MNKKETFVIGSYNMSWYSGDPTKILDDKKDIASEYQWLKYLFVSQNINSQNNDENRCKFWLNSKQHLEKFMTENKASMVALQEMNPNIYDSNGNVTNTEITTNVVHSSVTTYLYDNKKNYKEITIDKYEENELLGTKGIENLLIKINNENKTNYKQVCGQVINYGSLIGICIIYDENIFGKVKDTKIYDDRIIQRGRPILFAYTDKGYVLSSMHGAQDPVKKFNENDDFDKYMIVNNKNVFEKECVDFVNNKVVKAIFLGGDFNDRYDEIKNIKVNVGNKDMNLSIKDAPITGCPDWNSAAPGGAEKTDKNKGDKIETKEDVNSNNYTGNKVVTKEYYSDKGFFTFDEDKMVDNKGEKVFSNPNDKKIALFPEHAKVGNYLYRGDKVFGGNHQTIAQEVKVFESQVDNNGVSICSDHELAYSTITLFFNVSVSGGKRKTKKMVKKLKKTLNNKKNLKKHKKSIRNKNEQK